MNQIKVLTLLEAQLADELAAMQEVKRHIHLPVADFNYKRITITDKAFVKLCERRQFYAQSFTPSLIPELFEGWAHKDGVYSYRTEKQTYLIEYHRGRLTIHGPVDSIRCVPNNIDDFTNACNQSGLLKLMDWKSEVVEKHSFLSP